MTHTRSRIGLAKIGLAKIGLAQIGQIRMAKTSQMCTFGLSGCGVKPSGFRAAGASHNNPRTPRAHLSSPALQTPPKFHDKTRREGRKERILRREEKKARNFGPPTLRAPTLRSPGGRLRGSKIRLTPPSLVNPAFQAATYSGQTASARPFNLFRPAPLEANTAFRPTRRRIVGPEGWRYSGWRPKPGKSGGPKGGAQEGARRVGGSNGWGAQNVALFFPLPPHFSFFRKVEPGFGRFVF